ncbi:MAG: hypothetical protein OQK46_11130, partial [Gammaproteobacteria bacterium]|nr:hypothetical protein [Gammaproteobacteria bacterium]
MTKHIIPILAFLLLFSQPTLAATTESFDINHLQSLFENYKRGQSYKYAKQYQTEMEGDPYFDYLFG